MSETLMAPAVFAVERSTRGRLRLTGHERQSFLQGMITNDVANLTPGTGCYAFLLDATGHILNDMRVLATEEYLLLDLEPEQASFVAETLDKYLIMEKCKIEDVTAATAQVFVGGNRASEMLIRAGVTVEDSWLEGRNRMHGDLLFAATHLLSVPGFDIYGSPQAVTAFIDELRSSAETASVTVASADPELLTALRVEAGVPLFGVDFDSRVLAPETGQTSRAISYKKGCYVGQEIVARIDARGHTNRTFAGFILRDGGAAPAPEAVVTLEDGKEIGRITSGAWSPKMNMAIALGYVRMEQAASGTAVLVGGRAAEVSELPFVRPEEGE
jgi:folate-binding protein YgfZ